MNDSLRSSGGNNSVLGTFAENYTGGEMHPGISVNEGDDYGQTNRRFVMTAAGFNTVKASKNIMAMNPKLRTLNLEGD